MTEPLLDQPDNFVLLPEVQQPKAPTQRDGIFPAHFRHDHLSAALRQMNSVGFEDTEVYGVFGAALPDARYRRC